MRSLRRLGLAQATALVIAGAAATLTALAALASWQTGRALTAVERAEHAATADQTRWRLQTVVAQDEARLATAAFSDALYAELGRLAERRDSTFRPAFADPFAGQHRDQFIGVYDLQATPLFRWTASGSLGLDGTIVSNALFRILDNREATAGLLRRGDEVFWVAGAPVLPAGAPSGAPIRGYVLTARSLRPGDLSPVHAGRAMPVDLDPITPTREPARTVVSVLAGGDSVRIAFPLSDIFAERTSEATVRADRSAFRALESRVQLLLAGTLVMIAVLGVLGWWLARRWVVRPVTRFAQALAPIHEGQTPTLLPTVSSAAEWQAAVGAVNRLLTHTRTSTERSERLVGVVRDGVWACDIATNVWTFNERSRELLGWDETAPPLDGAAFEALIHPDHREETLAAVRRCGRDGGELSLEVQLRRRDGAFGWYRLAARIHRDHNGAPTEMVGRLVSLDDEHAGRDRAEALRAEMLGSRRTHGRVLTAIAERAPDADWADAAAFVGRALYGTVSAVSEPFDLHQTLQQLAGAGGSAVQVAISPGLATRVAGDRQLIARALAPLLDDAIAAGGDVSLRAERADGPDAVRLLVERRGGRATSDQDRSRLERLLATGLPDDPEADARDLLRLQAAHHALAALGATTGVDPVDGGGSRATITIALPAVAPEYVATEIADFGDPAAAPWQDAAPWADAGSDAATAAASQTSAEPPVELVADATVTINLDEPPPSVRAAAAARVIDPGFLAQLEPGERQSLLARQMATAFLKDAPERAHAIRNATGEGELATARALAENLGGMAGLVTAEALARACAAFVAAASESTTGLESGLDAIDTALATVTLELQRVVRPIAEPTPPAGPPIDADTLAQLRASIAVDRLGLGGQLVSMFISEAPLRLEALERAALGRDLPAFRSTAADLKNMCNLVGAGSLGSRCEALDADPPQPDQVATIRAELDRARQTLEELLQAGAHA